MFVVIRTFKQVHSMEEAARRAQSGIGEIVKRLPGFGGYFVFDAGEGLGGSLTFFATKEAAEEASEVSLAWIRASLADQGQGEPEIIVAKIVASVESQTAPVVQQPDTP